MPVDHAVGAAACSVVDADDAAANNPNQIVGGANPVAPASCFSGLRRNCQLFQRFALLSCQLIMQMTLLTVQLLMQMTLLVSVVDADDAANCSVVDADDAASLSC